MKDIEEERKKTVGNTHRHNLVVALGLRLIGRHSNRVIVDDFFDDWYSTNRSLQTRFRNSGRNDGIHLNPFFYTSCLASHQSLGIVQFEIFFRRTLAHGNSFVF